MLKLPPTFPTAITFNEIIAKFGGADQLRNAVKQFQSLLNAA